MPTEGELAAKVTCVRPQVDEPVWSGPALAEVGDWLAVPLTATFWVVAPVEASVTFPEGLPVADEVSRT